MTQTKLKMSTAYHPQTDGQTERVNQCLEGYLRCFVHACPHQWKKWLALAEFWYNTSFHTSLNSTPFEILYGQKPRHLGIDVIQSCAVPDVQMWLQDRSTMVQLLQQQLVRAQQRQKQQADKHRTERSFEVGDSVYLKLQPYVQTSVATRANHKLSFRYFGPYQVIAKVGSVAYKLLLPDNTSIHPVFHVSQLKKAISPSLQVSTELPHSVASDTLRFPIKVLQRRLKPHGDHLVSEVLIQWSAWPTSMATWELETELKQQFPAAPAWGQAGSQEGRDVRNPVPVRQDEAEDEIAGRTTKGKAEENTSSPHGPSKREKPKRRRKPNPKNSGPSWIA
jgi:ribosomal protein L21E